MNLAACTGGARDVAAASRGRVVFGAVVMLVGALLLADRFDWWGVRVNVPMWPWVLILLGSAKMGRRRWHPINRAAWWLIAVGIWGLLIEYRLLGFGYRRGWPLLILIAGIFMVWRAIDPPDRHNRRGGRS